MIKSPITYSQETLDKLSAFVSDGKLDPDFWADEEVAGIRTEIKDFYKEVQHYTCPYCEQQITVASGRAWDIDHIVPKTMCPGYMFEPLNLCVACIDCNTFKRDKPVLSNGCNKNYPKNTERFQIAHPHFDSYGDHILKIEPALFLALSEKGRHTIDFCNLHRFSYKFALGDATLSRLPKATETWNRIMRADPSEELEIQVTTQADGGPQVTVTIK